ARGSAAKREARPLTAQGPRQNPAIQMRSTRVRGARVCTQEGIHDRSADLAPLPVTHTSASGDFSLRRFGVVKRKRLEPCSPTISRCTAIMFSMRFSDGVTVRTRKALKPHWLVWR